MWLSRLMGLDEAGTAQALRDHRSAANPLIAQHGGRIVKTTGDGVLIERFGGRCRPMRGRAAKVGGGAQFGNPRRPANGMAHLNVGRTTGSRGCAPSPLYGLNDFQFRKPEHRERYLSGLRLAAGETT